MSQLNSALSRFEEAASIHTAIHALRLRAGSVTPGLTDEQRAKRLGLIELMCSLLEKSRDEAVELGIHEWHQHKEET